MRCIVKVHEFERLCSEAAKKIVHLYTEGVLGAKTDANQVSEAKRRTAGVLGAKTVN